MKQDQMIRERIQSKVFEASKKKCRNVFYLTDDGDKSYYCICGNNNNIFGVASVNSKNEIEVIL